MAGFLEQLVGPGLGTPRSTTCLYTLTSDRDFVCDRVPELPQLSVALGAAHGFKFAAWFGRTLAGLACGEPAGPELAPFSFARPSLRVPISPRCLDGVSAVASPVVTDLIAVDDGPLDPLEQQLLAGIAALADAAVAGANVAGARRPASGRARR